MSLRVSIPAAKPAPEKCGQRLLPHLIDERANAGHKRPCFSIPISNDPKDGFRDISYKEFSNAVNRCSWYLDDTLGKAKNFETFAYIGPPDMRYRFLTVAAMKTKHRVFFTSPRNSIEAHVSLMKQAECLTILVSSPPPPFLNALMEQYPMRVMVMPEVDHFLDDRVVPHYPFTKSFEEARMDPWGILHTSGSTGVPKIIVMNHGYVTAQDALQDFARFNCAPTQAVLCQGRRIFVSFPPFHAAGLFLSLPGMMYFDATAVLPPPGPLTADTANSIHKYGNVQGAFLPPSILADLAQTQDSLDALGTMSFVSFGGGPLPPSAGDVILEKTYIMNFFGVTETNLYALEIQEPEEWPYFKYSPLMGCEFRPISEELYELVIVRDEKLRLIQGVFCTFPGIQEWHTKDLYSKHPTCPGLWKYRGRADDVIVFSNGEKLNPLTMEGIITGHPDVEAALVVGQGRFQSGLLVEPKDRQLSNDGKMQLCESLWPTVELANKDCVAHGRISKDLLLVASPEKPFSRAGKGTVQRQLTVSKYKDEIDLLYDSASSSERSTASPVDMQDPGIVKDILRRVIIDQTGFHDIEDSNDFFLWGIDSLHVASIASELSENFDQAVLPRTIYSHPSIDKLTQALTGSSKTDDTSPMDRIQQMKSLVEQFTTELPLTTRSSSIKPRKSTILMTGSTGSLGSYILDQLLSNKILANQIDTVYCLNRSEDAKERQIRSHQDRGLSTSLEKNQRVQFIHGDVTKPYFSLSIPLYHQLLSSTTHILHNAWPVEFNFPLASFDSQIQGVRRLVDFSSRSSYGSSIFFISSIGTVLNWSHPTPVPEKIVNDWSVSEPIGYAESKYVCERLLNEASRIAGIDATICRVGQIAGPVTKGEQGMWRKAEWLPSIITSSYHLGKIPQNLGPMTDADWIPVDLLARIIGELLLLPGQNTRSRKRKRSQESDQNDNTESMDHDGIGLASTVGGNMAQVYHTVNPSRTPWTELLPTILSHFTTEHRPEVVQFTEWVKAVRQSDEASEASRSALDQNPAVKLLPFFSALANMSLMDRTARAPLLDTSKTRSQSATLRKLDPLSAEWMSLWMMQWGYTSRVS